MLVYIDNDYKCHTNNDGTMRSVDVPFFDRKCAEFIEGYRYVPEGETWVRSDGVEFRGEFFAPWRKYKEIAEIQNAVDRTQAEADEELAALIEEIYQNDLEMMEE